MSQPLFLYVICMIQKILHSAAGAVLRGPEAVKKKQTFRFLERSDKVDNEIIISLRTVGA